MIPRRLPDTAPRPASRTAIHPVVVRIAHWTNAVAMTVMIMSGLAIHNAYPILPFAIPDAFTMGGGLIGALQWHFAAMWLLAINGLVYVAFGFVSGRFRRKLTPLSLAQALRDGTLALKGRLGHTYPAHYNGVQRLMYVGVIATGVMAVLSGLAIWKPVQFQPLTMLLGDFDNARIVHFVAMGLIVLFILVHVVMALLVPRSLRAMIRGH